MDAHLPIDLHGMGQTAHVRKFLVKRKAQPQKCQQASAPAPVPAHRPNLRRKMCGLAGEAVQLVFCGGVGGTWPPHDFASQFAGFERTVGNEA